MAMLLKQTSYNLLRKHTRRKTMNARKQKIKQYTRENTEPRSNIWNKVGYGYATGPVMLKDLPLINIGNCIIILWVLVAVE